MASLERSPLQLRAILASHVALQLVDWRRPGSADDVERHSLMRATAQAFHFKVKVIGIECVAQRGRRLRRSLKAEHPLVPRLARQTVGRPSDFCRSFCGGTNRRAINAFARLGGHRLSKRVMWLSANSTMAGSGGHRNRVGLWFWIIAASAKHVSRLFGNFRN